MGLVVPAKVKATGLEAEKMAAAGLACVEIAKQNGSWTILDEVEERIIQPTIKGIQARGITYEGFVF